MKTFAQFIKETSREKSMTVAPSSTEKVMTTQFTAEKQEPERTENRPEDSVPPFDGSRQRN